MNTRTGAVGKRAVGPETTMGSRTRRMSSEKRKTEIGQGESHCQVKKKKKKKKNGQQNKWTNKNLSKI